MMVAGALALAGTMVTLAVHAAVTALVEVAH